MFLVSVPGVFARTLIILSRPVFLFISRRRPIDSPEHFANAISIASNPASSPHRPYTYIIPLESEFLILITLTLLAAIEKTDTSGFPIITRVTGGLNTKA